MKKNNSPDKVGFGEKIGLLLVNLGSSPFMALLSTFFLFFYTDVVGLDANKVATLFLISKIMDGLNDPIVGFFLDRARVTKMGKFRPLVILGTLVCVVNFILLWFGAVWLPAIQYVMVYATYLLLGVTFDIMNVPILSLLPVMTADMKERNSLSLVQALAGMLGMALCSAIPPMIVANGTLQEYYILIFGSMAIALITIIPGALAVKERVVFKGSEEEKYSVRDLLHFLVEQPVLVFFICDLLYVIGGNAAAGMNAHFFTYVIGDLSVMGSVSLFMIVGMIPSIIFATPVANKFGKKAAFSAGLMLCAASSLVRLLDIRSVPLIIVSNLLLGMGGGIVMPAIFGVQADNILYIKQKTGKRAEAAMGSLSAYLAKIGQGIAGALPGYILAWTGFVPKAATQSDSVINGMIVCVIWLPFIFLALSAIIFAVWYNISKKEADKLAAGAKAENERLATQNS